MTQSPKSTHKTTQTQYSSSTPQMGFPSGLPTYAVRPSLGYEIQDRGKEYAIEISSQQLPPNYPIQLEVVGCELRISTKNETPIPGYYAIMIPHGVNYTKISSKIGQQGLVINLPKYVEVIKPTTST